VLYSGPMFQVYNTMLRRFPAQDFEQFQQGGNQFATTIFVLQSAVIKIARVMRLPPGLELFRGLGGLAELPDSFDRADAHGCVGYMEWGFLSTTSHRQAAVDYSGAGEGKPLPTVIQTRASSIDRGACIKDLSQYPAEVNAQSRPLALRRLALPPLCACACRTRMRPGLLEPYGGGVQVEYLWPAGCFIERSGPSYTVEGGGGLLTMVPVRINANGKARTVEEQRTQKKDMHVAAFRYLLADTARDLVRIAEDERAEDRLARDPSRVIDLQIWLSIGGRVEWLLPSMSDGTEVTFTVAGLVARIVGQCETVLARHAALPPERYNDDDAFRHTVAEMLDTRAAAVGTLRLYIESPGEQMQAVMRDPITTRLRGYLAFLERTLPAAGEARALAAARVCRTMGAMQSSADETDAEGLTPLMRAAADGAGGRVLRCLAAARADVNAREAKLGRTALWLAASFGHAEAVEALAGLGGDVDAASEPGAFDSTPMRIAAQEGHTAVIEVLGRLGADVNRAVKDGRTPVYMAAANGHTAAIEALGRLGADVNRAVKGGRTPVYMAAAKGHTAAIEALGRLGADLNQAEEDGWTPMFIAAQEGHTAVIEALGRLGADVNQADEDGWTPLRSATSNGHVAAADALRRLGAVL
jgi:ankyrin repeat protein